MLFVMTQFSVKFDRLCLWCSARCQAHLVLCALCPEGHALLQDVFLFSLQISFHTLCCNPKFFFSDCRMRWMIFSQDVLQLPALQFAV